MIAINFVDMPLRFQCNLCFLNRWIYNISHNKFIDLNILLRCSKVIQGHSRFKTTCRSKLTIIKRSEIIFYVRFTFLFLEDSYILSFNEDKF